MADPMQYKCPNCGGQLEFDSASQNMKCPFCISEFDVQSLRTMDEQLNAAPAEDESSMNWETEAGSEWSQGEADNLRVYSCQSCGGEVIADATTGASKCPYCENPVIMTGQFSGDLKPDIVIPFKLDKEAAKAALLKHMEGKPLLPKIFKSQNQIDEIKGVYVPVWLFDADVNADIHYRAKKEKRWSDANYKYTETQIFSVRRRGRLSFSNVPVDGSTKMEDAMMESLEPFDCKQAVPFQTAFLSGYLADRYDVDADASVERANKRIEQSTLDEFRKTLNGYDSVTVEHINIHLQNGQAKYALYPVWLLNTTWNDQKFTFGMNGQTGKFVGNLPTDKGKAALIFAIVTVAATVITYLIRMFLQ